MELYLKDTYTNKKKRVRQSAERIFFIYLPLHYSLCTANHRALCSKPLMHWHLKNHYLYSVETILVAFFVKLARFLGVPVRS